MLLTTISIFLLSYGAGNAVILKSNVCKNFNDYFDMDNSPNCWHNPDVNAPLSDWITKKGFPLETYKVVSEDGYITSIYRMPRAKPNKGVVYLLHPATATMSIWLDKGINDSLGYMMYNAGYDVWMGNSRGSDYGNEHVSMTQNDTKYWDFSFHEMAMYDLPKQLEFVKNTTGSKAVFIAHSMGSTIGYVYAAMKPEHAKSHVHVFFLAGPGGYFEKFKLPHLEWIARFVDLGYFIMKSINYLKLVGREDYLTNYTLQFCKDTPTGLILCPYLSRFALGINTVRFNAAFIPVALTHYPGGVPMKAFAHFGQWLGFKHLRYRMFDYGKRKNWLIYKSDLPPKYPLHKITTPTVVIAGEYDYISTIEGVEAFYEQLPDAAKIYGYIKIPEYNHADILMAEDCGEVAYKPLIEFIDSLQLFNTISP